MPAPLLIDVSHTCHTRARTGIQRVTRSLHTALGAQGIAITHDPHRAAWRTLERWELANLAATAPATKRGARWPLSARWRGQLHRWTGLPADALPEHRGLVVPEVFSPAVGAALPALLSRVQGPRVALFHDAIALQFPELSPAKTVARFPAYLVELLAFDGIAAVSEHSRRALVEYWRWLGVSGPPVEAIPLGVDVADSASAVATAARERSAPPVVLAVGTIEGRKNHVALLEACEQLWARGATFSLHLVGLAQPQTGGAALARIAQLRTAGRPLRYDGPASETELEDAYAECAFTVYPSRIEGFGLPVIESLAHGKPCVCSARGALGESARGGGCVALDEVDAASLAAAIARLLASPAEIEALAAAARARRFKRWTEYAQQFTDWMETLPNRSRAT